MSETQVLLAKITALRQRLEQAQGLASEARSAAQALEQAVASGGEHDRLVDVAVRPATGHPAESVAPPPLSARARRVLERGRELLGSLRNLADDFDPDEDAEPGPLVPLYRDTVSLLDTCLRTVELMPASTAAQLHLCRGLEVTLGVVADRLRTLGASSAGQRAEREQVEQLAGLLVALDEGKPVDVPALRELAGRLVGEARECEPLGFLEADPGDLPRWVASNSLNVARVMARVVRHVPEVRGKSVDAVLSALLHDVGMLRAPADLVVLADPLDAEQRGAVEAHARLGGHLVGGLFPDSPWLARAALGHHERLDGTGYPEGLKGNQQDTLTRLLAVCDVYAAMCVARPHRPARPTRTALADTLLLADQGLLDRDHAACLLHLSFYPVGSVVELAHGAVGVVVATPCAVRDLRGPARPVVAVLTDSEGQALPRLHHLDLAQSDQHSIVRALGRAERRELLERFPEWAA
jgi:hypothetical protein